MVELREIIGDLRKVETELSKLEELAAYAPQLEEVVQHTSEPLMLMVMGSFSTGKSTFINALVGRKIAAVAATPTTAVVTKLCYGAEDELTVFFKDGSSENCDPCDFAKLTTVSDDTKENALHDKIDYVERKVPIAFLQGVSIIDSPGLNEVSSEERNDAAERFAVRADTVLWMFSASQPGTAKEVEAIGRLALRLKPIAILNKMDQLDEEEDDPQDFLTTQVRKLGDKVQTVVPISAKLAWEGRQEGDADKEKLGNLAEIEQTINTLVRPQRERLKLNTLLDELGAFLSALSADYSLYKAKNEKVRRQDYNKYIQVEEAILQLDQVLNGAIAKVREYCDQEAALRNEQAMYLLGVLYESGFGELPDEEKALEWYQKAAIKKHLAAMRYMYNYHKKAGDNQACAYWLAALAEQGVVEAQYAYARKLLADNEGKKAVEWLARAGEQGYVTAQWEVAEIYAAGRFVPVNEQLACDWYRKASEQGHRKAQIALGECYHDGRGIAQDLGKAFYWYQKAAEQGRSVDQFRVAECYKNGDCVGQDLQAALSWYKKAAEQGYALAQVEVGTYLSTGLGGIQPDFAQAFGWYKKAADQGLALGQYQVGECYFKGLGVKESKGSAYDWYKKAAEQGYAEAQNMVGQLINMGEGGFFTDADDAVKWYKRAAEQGNLQGQLNLALCYEEGWGAPSDLEEARKWFLKAAGQKLPEAQYKMGIYTQNGLGGGRTDVGAAYEWYLEAARQGHKAAKMMVEKLAEEGWGSEAGAYMEEAAAGKAEAQYRLAWCYVHGLGVAENLETAIKWFTKAAEQGYAASQTQLGISHSERWSGVKQDYALAFDWFERAAKQGYAAAQYHVGNCYNMGQGVVQHKVTALQWYERAARQGHPEAQTMLGVLLSEGWGSSHDRIDAVNWFARAAEQGEANAQFLLGKCYEEGKGVKADRDKAYRWYLEAAMRNLAQAQYKVGVFLHQGLGKVKADAAAGYRWYTKAAEQGYAEAQLMVGRYFAEGWGKVRESRAEAVRWYQKAVGQELPLAQYYLAECYHNGKGTFENRPQAYQLYLKAAKGGVAAAQNMVGRYLEEGWGRVAKNEEEALHWYKKAAEQNNLNAKANLARHHVKGGLTSGIKKISRWFKH